MTRLKVKPLSANQSHRATGKVYRTPAYRAYEKSVRALLLTHPRPAFAKDAKLKFTANFGVSSQFDLDNCVKPFIDILEKAYEFNDKNVLEIHVKKHSTKRGEEYIEFALTNIGE